MYSIWTQTVVAPFSLPFSIYRCSMDGDGGAELVSGYITGYQADHQLYLCSH